MSEYRQKVNELMRRESLRVGKASHSNESIGNKKIKFPNREGKSVKTPARLVPKQSELAVF